MGLLNREAFLKSVPLPSEDVQVPSMGGAVRVRGLTVGERTQFELAITTGKGRNRDVNIRQMREKLLLMTLVGEDGAQLLKDEDRECLSRLPAKDIERLFDKARELSGMTQQDVDELGNA